MATHSSILDWRRMSIPWTEKPGRLHLLLVRKAMTNLDSVLKRRDNHFANKSLYSQSYGISGRRQWHPTPVLLPGKISWTEEPGRLQSMGSLRVRHDWATSLSLFTFMHCRRQWHPTPVLLPGKIPGTGELGGLLSMGSHRVRHDWSDLAAAAAWYFQ